MHTINFETCGIGLGRGGPRGWGGELGLGVCVGARALGGAEEGEGARIVAMSGFASESVNEGHSEAQWEEVVVG